MDDSTVYMFKVGQRVRRTGPDYKGVKSGWVYTVDGVYGTIGISLCGQHSQTFDPRYFERMEQYTPEGPYQKPFQNYVEADPTGRAANAPGAKLDAGKPRPSLVIEGMARATMAVSKVATFGANKYSDGGWVDVPNGEARYADAGYRHVLKRAMGEEVDKDSEELHLAHEAWNALAKLDLFLRNKEKTNASS